uniref:Uncharacterized protein n=1 Tax=Anguilla anguilla TaxID=7936 RepID=A0A0E9WGU4_ANGAN
MTEKTVPVSDHHSINNLRTTVINCSKLTSCIFLVI